MTLLPDWRRVLRRAWSVRLMVLSSVIIILDPVIGVLADLSGNLGTPIRVAVNVLAGTMGLAAVWARVIKQKEFEDAD